MVRGLKRKVMSQGLHIWNVRALSYTIQKFWARLRLWTDKQNKNNMSIWGCLHIKMTNPGLSFKLRWAKTGIAHACNRILLSQGLNLDRNGEKLRALLLGYPDTPMYLYLGNSVSGTIKLFTMLLIHHTPISIVPVLLS